MMRNKIIRDQDLIEALEALERLNESLEVKSAQLIKENHHLRRINHVQPHVRLVQRAYAAAVKMTILHIAGYKTGRKSCWKAGISEQSFHAGKAMLRLARVHDGTEFTNNDGALIAQKLLSTLKFATENQGSLDARIIPSRRKTV
jgi:hypothetical protein